MTPMKTLIIMRHGEAAAYEPNGDYARALTEAGQRDVARQAQRLLAGAWPLPTHMLVSSAQRTGQTAALVASVLATPICLSLKPELYRADADGYYQMVLHTLTDDVACGMIVGHNPAVSWLTQTLTKSASIDLPPAGVCVLQTQQSWSSTSTFQLVAQYGD